MKPFYDQNSFYSQGFFEYPLWVIKLDSLRAREDGGPSISHYQGSASLEIKRIHQKQRCSWRDAVRWRSDFLGVEQRSADCERGAARRGLISCKNVNFAFPDLSLTPLYLKFKTRFVFEV